MTVVQSPDGRLLRSTAPSGMPFATTMGPPALWSDGERHAGGSGGRMVSFARLYESQPIVAAVVNKIARQVATLPLHVYEKNGPKLNRVDDSNSLATLLRAPLPRRSALDLQQWMSFPALLHGNALIAKYRADQAGPPTALLPIDWPTVNAYAQVGMPVEWWSTVQFGAEQRYLAADDTMHFAWHALPSGIGISPLEQLATSIRLEDAAQRYQTASFRNGARPGGVVTLPPGKAPSEEQMLLTRQTLENLHKGVDRAFTVGLLAPGATWQPMTQSSVEAELISQRELNRLEIAMVYDIDPPVIGDLRHGTYANVSEVLKAFYKITLPPWLSLFESVLQSQLIDPEPEWAGLTCRFDLSEQLKGEPQELAATLQTEIATGVRTPNEGRDRLGLPRDPDPAADMLYLPVNNIQPIGTAPTKTPNAIADTAAPPAAGGKRIVVKRDAAGNATEYVQE